MREEWQDAHLLHRWEDAGALLKAVLKQAEGDPELMGEPIDEAKLKGDSVRRVAKDTASSKFGDLHRSKKVPYYHLYADSYMNSEPAFPNPVL